MTLDPRAVARALGGNVSGHNVVAPGPATAAPTARSRSKLSRPPRTASSCIRLPATRRLNVAIYVRAALGLGGPGATAPTISPRRSRTFTVAPDNDADHRSALALRLWNEARDPRGTVVDRLSRLARPYAPRRHRRRGDPVSSVRSNSTARRWAAWWRSFGISGATRRAESTERFSTAPDASSTARCSAAPATLPSSSTPTKT